MDRLFTFTARSGSKDNFEALDPSIKNRTIAAAQEYNASTGKTLIINSGKRDPADQLRLYNETVAAGRPGKGPNGMAVAPPGKSRHEKGLAVDIQNYADAMARSAMNRQGLTQGVPGDPVHFQLPQAREGGIFSGADSGFPVELHGNELVAPLDPNSILAKMLTASPSEAAAMMPTSGSGSASSEMTQTLMDRFDTIINYLSEWVDIEQRILRQT
jgi:hypothetical protein